MLRPAGRRGFTLVELVVAMSIAALLALAAVPALESPLRKSRRASAVAALSAAHLRQEVRRTSRPDFDPATEVAALRASPSALHYHFDAALPHGSSAASSYRLSATARGASTQSRDAGCQYLRIEVIDGDVRHEAGADAASASAGPAAQHCWSRT